MIFTSDNGGRGDHGGSNAPLPEKPVDGIDFSALLHDPNAPAHRDTFFCYLCYNLHAVRRGDWKLHVHSRHEPLRALYNLRDDPGERQDVYGQHPRIAAELEALIEGCRRELGDERLGVAGAGVCPIGRLADPKPLTEYDETRPYIIALYDTADKG